MSKIFGIQILQLGFRAMDRFYFEVVVALIIQDLIGTIHC